MGLIGMDPKTLFVGSVLCPYEWPCPAATRFECNIRVLEPTTPILPGLHVSLQTHAVRESAQISRLLSLIGPKKSLAPKARPRCLTKHQNALIEVTVTRPICLEEFSSFRALGRIALRESGRTIAVGIVSKICDV